jgi:hypothetical protein
MTVETGQIRRWFTTSAAYEATGFRTGDTFLVINQKQAIDSYDILLSNGIVKTCFGVIIELESEVLGEAG